MQSANDLSPIPKPLLDRMEIIELSSYTENEKFHIAENYLIKKQRKLSGLTKKQVSISEWKLSEKSFTPIQEKQVCVISNVPLDSLCIKQPIKLSKGKRVDIKKKSLKNFLGRHCLKMRM